MGLSTKLNNILKKPLIETIINLIKKLKSSKSYWSLSYLILLFTIREAIAWKYGEGIQKFCEAQATDSSYPFVWNILGFIFDVGGSIELVGLGLSVFLILSIVKVSESESNVKSTSIKEKLFSFLIALLLISIIYTISYYQNQGSSKDIQTHATNEANKTRDYMNKVSKKQTDDLLKALNIYGNKEKFLNAYFGDDWDKKIINEQTYHNLKSKLDKHKGNIQTLIEEKEKLQKKIESRRLHSNGVQEMVNKAFNELRFDDVLSLLNNFTDNNKGIKEDLISASYQKALAYMEKIEYHKAKKEFEENIPPGIKDTDILHDYATMHYTLGEYDKAIEFYNKALKIYLATLGENHPSTASTYNNLGLAWSDKGEYDKAIEFYNKALKITLATLGENHPHTKIVKNNIEELKEKLKK